MKRQTVGAIAAFLMIMLMIASLIGCGANNGNKRAAEREAEREAERFAASYEKLTGERPPKGNGDTPYGSSFISYGKWGDTEVLFMPSVLPAVHSITVAGSRFDYSSYFTLYAYRDGELIELSDAYEKGWLNEAQIAEAAKIHKEVHRDNPVYASEP